MSDRLSEDLIAEIFQRLPPKSLLRFRSLSKSWCSRIASPDFIRKHTLRSMTTSQKVVIRHQIHYFKGNVRDIYTLHSEDKLPLCPKRGYMGITGVEFPTSNHKMVASCNGIMCLYDDEVDSITLWNISIRRKLTLPDHPPCVVDFSESSRDVIGFGFDPIADDYKVLTISYHKYKEGSRSSFVYSMKTNSWSEIASPITKFFNVKTRACFVNGKLHWVVVSYLTKSKTERNDFIMTFDLTTHVFSRILLPELPNGPKKCTMGGFTLSSSVSGWSTRELTVIDGSLAAVSASLDGRWISVMREYGNVASWSIICKLEGFGNPLHRVLQPTTNGDLLFHTFSGVQQAVYNPNTGFSPLLDFKASCMDITYNNIEMETYVESLELLDTRTACGETIIPWTEKEQEKEKRKRKD